MENNENNENLETTKEILSLKDFALEATNTEESVSLPIIEEAPIEALDENMDESDLVFDTVVKTKEDIANNENKENNEPKAKKNIFKALKDKWSKLDKKKKIIVIVVTLILIVLIILGIILLVTNNKDNNSPTENIVLESDNYRYENGRLIFLDNDKEIGEYECKNKDENNCAVFTITSHDKLDNTIKVNENNEEISVHAKIYDETYAFIIDHGSSDDKSILLYNIKNNTVEETVFDVIMYGDNYVSVKNNESKYGLLEFKDETVKTLIPYDYDELSLITEGDTSIAVVKKDNNSYLASLDNKILTKAFNETITGANSSHVKTKDDNGKYSIYDYEAKKVSDETYDYVSLLDNIMLVVRDNALYVYDYENNKMMDGSLSLNNDAYNKIETYKNKKLIKTKQAYTYELTGNLLNINIYTDDDSENHSINLLEGALSSKLAYMNYFAGKLSFYADETKKNKIGEYTCTNQNQVDSNTTTLNNCRLATESFLRETDSNNKETDASASLGWIPIIGSRYAFITDGDTIKLYDFKDNKELANYSEVDTFSYTNASEVTFSNASSVSFIAKSKRTGKYGVAKISADGVKPILEFQFASIKALGNYYVVEEDGKYALYSLEGEKKTSDYNSPVVDYLGSYVKTKKDNAYFVHGFNEEVSSDSYTYVELYNNYYAGVLQNTVEIYDYKGKSITKNLPEKTRAQLKLQINNFYGQGTKAFVITFKSGEYATAKIGTVSGSYDTVIIPLDTTSIGDSNDE